MSNPIPTMARVLIEHGLSPRGVAKGPKEPTHSIEIDLSIPHNAFAISMLKDGPLTRENEELIRAMQKIYHRNPLWLSIPNLETVHEHAQNLLGTKHFAEILKNNGFNASVVGGKIILKPR